MLINRKPAVEAGQVWEVTERWDDATKQPVAKHFLVVGVARIRSGPTVTQSVTVTDGVCEHTIPPDFHTF
ncbi:hypothetical protein KKE47_03250 [Patescibacteria group bacterium]|nr:hypothetical protein [Patescibacteria group bacterium]MBU4265056.1 hypothetical protein [Patescibacteria group bacterium]MBU4390265.1 hypothetical protein [Patescibacteria group bacterium]MBU4578633.1 hypothetical protein [Patescibacteria group bacterium]MCG2702514.1 hypothetical protein [Candidatus Parcubacteria bacterium]